MDLDLFRKAYEIVYYENEEEKSFLATMKFLTPELRSKVNGHNATSQKEQKAIRKADKKEEETEDKIKELLRLKKEANPDISEEELSNYELSERLKLLDSMSEEEITERQKRNDEFWDKVNATNIKFFKLIVDTKKLPEDIRTKIGTGENSDFWKNVFMGSVYEINNSFRRIYSL